MELLRAEGLAIGYGSRIITEGIELSLERGKIMTLVGPNGAGKSTLLKSVTGQIPLIRGKVLLEGKDLKTLSPKETARKIAMVLTDRVRPELTSCRELVAMGRYPYTGLMGRLEKEDLEKIDEALAQVRVTDLSDRDFSTLSDGQRQRVLLARALCQEPSLLVLDEPTAYLDIRYKIELLEILRRMAKEKNMAILMSLHEIDLAMKVSDLMLPVKEGRIPRPVTPEEFISQNTTEDLFDIDSASLRRWYHEL
ncbi:MAG: ABC transporter ATP-binding protein [Firmicutes bacterium]|nr:ABC transporter ATP-binding protein [Bacillota bacterium]